MRRYLMLVCVAVAVVLGGSSLAEASTGWTLQKIPVPSGSMASVLYGVSCTSASDCIAAGYSAPYVGNANLTLAVHWNGKAWSIQPTPVSSSGPYGSEFLAISCTSATSCMAVGSDSTTYGSTPLAEQWNGSTWTVQSVPLPPGAAEVYAEFFGVSCVSPADCTAVGYYNKQEESHPDLHRQVPLAEHWNGTSWAPQSAIVPRENIFSTLNAVSCASATACTAVGYVDNGSVDNQMVAEYWNGTTWVIQHTPGPFKLPGGTLNGVSCVSVSDCIAVGQAMTTKGVAESLVLAWNGTTWAIQHVPNPPGFMNSTFNGISCSSATDCTAAGNYNGPSEEAPLAEHWNGTKWVIQITPNSADGASFSGISCGTATTCTAVGGSVAEHN
jgi:hypothetical protein